MPIDVDIVYDALKRSSINGTAMGDMKSLERDAADALSRLAVHVMLEDVDPDVAKDTFDHRASRVMVMIAVVIQAVKSAGAGQADHLEQFLRDVVRA